MIESIDGDAKVSRLSLRNLDSERRSTLEVGGVFIFIGFIPNTTLVDAHIDHDKAGYY